MTIQIADKFVSHFNDINFEGFQLYAVLRGDPADKRNRIVYSLKNSPDKDKLEVSSACWEGYACSYELSEKGELALIGFWYPLALYTEPDEVYEVLEGDFWVCLRKEFFGDSLYVPFLDGKMVTNRDIWYEDPSFKLEEQSLLGKLLGFFK